MTLHTCTQNSPFIIGIDLGTTNSTIAYINTKAGRDTQIQTFEIPQLIEEGVIRPHSILPSFLYLPGEYELPEKAASLPWQPDISYIVGEYAKTLGARVSGRLVSSAKSWLCHSRVDRKAPILPWGAEEISNHVSPVQASAYYLKHMKEAWNYIMASDRSDYLFEEQQIIITIPASFDETARELTAEAAQLAGIDRFTMLEEPQAAFYCWVAFNEKELDNIFHDERLVLVIDIGGGTMDFNLINAWKEKGKLHFERVAVGEHLMLGGDNMDLALARQMEKKILGQKAKLDYQRWLSLAQQGRFAKESLLDNAESDKLTLSILGRGRSVIGGTLKTEITRQDVEEVILEGFFKNVDIGEDVEKDRRAGFQELGLPFVQDTIVLRHLALFLNRHASNPALNQFADTQTGKTFVRPDTILFNGGVFKSISIRNRTLEIINNWFGNSADSLTVLDNDRFEHAVSIGAAYYGMVLRGKGTRISGGSGRAYYIAIEGVDAGISGSATLLLLVCIVPRGFEEGEELHLQSPEFQVMTNRPVSFPLYTSSYRIGDKPGSVITAQKKDFIEMPPIKTVLHFGKKTGSVKIPVTLGIKLSEFGTLDVWCESKTTSHRWKLAFQVRADTEEKQLNADLHTLDAGLMDEACRILKMAFESTKKTEVDVTPENVLNKITVLFSLDKNDFPLSAIRTMLDTLIALKDNRTKSPQHEARWLNLCGYFLRPGFGAPLDEWRIKELWKLFHTGISCLTNTQCKLEWLILWRRVAGGLSQGQQEQVFNKIAPWLIPSRKRRDTPKAHGAELNEMWMLAASLEALSIKIKTESGETLLKLIRKGKAPAGTYWALSRLGARVPFHGFVDKIIPPETVEKWIKDLLSIPWNRPKEIAYTITQMARKTDDRTKEIRESLKKQVTEKLSQYNWATPLIQKINKYVLVEWEDQKKIFGESLPIGLYIERVTE